MHLSHRPRPAAERRAGTSAPLAVQTGAAAPDGIAAPGASARERRPWSVLFLLCAAQFMVILDITVVNIALPSIGRALHFATADLQWVVTTYLLFTGGLMLLGGRASDVLGRRRMFLAGLAVFTAASLASGLAPSAAALLAARGAQGLGAALLSPAALSIITATYTGRQRTAALTAWGALGSGGAAVGVLAGGLLTSGFGWRSVFLINVPVGVATGILSLRAVPAAAAAAGRERGRGRNLDLPGGLLVVAGLGVLVFALAGTGTHGWGSARTIVLLIVAAGLLAAFAAAERLAPRPLLPPSTWRSQPLVAGMAVMLGATGILVGAFFLNTLYLQDVLGASALTAGAEFLPMVLAIGLAAGLAAHLLPRAGARVLAVTGLAIMAGGGLLLAAATAGAGYVTGVLPGLLVLGLGIGLVFPAATVSAMTNVSAGQEGLASGMMTTAHEVGAALGVAVFAAVAAGNQAAAGAGLAAGYRHGFTVAAVVAAGLAIIALLAVPAARPAPGVRFGPH
jgi:EmrB/QacA subfamily drug resistance transporter